MEEITKEYSNGEITVVWQAHKCIHSANCWKGLGTVFNPKIKPWINISGASSDDIANQVHKCPSGALSLKADEKKKDGDIEILGRAMVNSNNTEIEVLKSGPLMVKGNLVIKHKDGKKEEHKEVYLCRCGQSFNKPFCDGTHKKCGFKDE